MTELKVKPIQTKEIEEEKKNTKLMHDIAIKTEINTQEDYEDAASIFNKIKDKRKELNKKRKDITRPLDKTKKKIMDMFRKPINMLKEAEDSIEQGILEYDKEQEKKRKEKQKELEKEDNGALEVAKPKQPEGMHTRTNWYAEVEDENKIPGKYLKVDMKALNRIARSSSGKVDIPGVVFKKKETVVSR